METASTFGEQHYPHLVVSDLQARAREWQGRFNSPLGLGVKKKVRTGDRHEGGAWL